MDRRHFFKSASVAGSSVLLPESVLGTIQTSHAQSAEQSQQAKQFLDNLRLTPLRGFHGQNISCDYLQVEGKIPSDLRGVFYRNGPGLFERGGQRYHHWFDGDGLVHAWRFTDHGVHIKRDLSALKNLLQNQKHKNF
jgi:carotenoid cleavage dioxygenase-like enzyme